MGCSPLGRYKSDMTERLHFHFSLSCIGEGNGNPLQCSCLENPRDRGAWWAAVHGVAQGRTRLKRLSSSSSSRDNMFKYHHTGIRVSPYEFEGDPTFPGISVGKESASNAEDKGRCEFDTQVRKIPWRRELQPTLVFLPGESHDQRIWWTTVHEVTQLDMTEATQQAHMHTSSNHPHG